MASAVSASSRAFAESADVAEAADTTPPPRITHAAAQCVREVIIASAWFVARGCAPPPGAEQQQQQPVGSMWEQQAEGARWTYGEEKDAERVTVAIADMIRTCGELSAEKPDTENGNVMAIATCVLAVQSAAKALERHGLRLRHDAEKLLNGFLIGLSFDMSMENAASLLIGVLGVSLANTVAAAADASARYVAASILRSDDLMAKEVVLLERALYRLYAERTTQWRGVNLGGWLFLERGPSAPMYESNEISGDRGEWDVTEQLGHAAPRVLWLHRRSLFSAADFAEISALQFNAVRLPFGYWIATGPTHNDSYLGPDLEALDAAVRLATEAGLEVLLDLHGCPGGESSYKTCGHEDPNWCVEQWRRDESVEVLRLVAARYKDVLGVTGLQVCNEPARCIEPEMLISYYVQSVAAIRQAGMRAERVVVVCPCWYVQDSIAEREFLALWNEHCLAGLLDGTVLDFHLYFFGDWANERDYGPVVEQAEKTAKRLARIPHAVVGEFSAAAETAPGHRLSDPTALSVFVKKQQDAYARHATHGCFFWTWRCGPPIGWSRCASYLSVDAEGRGV